MNGNGKEHLCVYFFFCTVFLGHCLGGLVFLIPNTIVKAPHWSKRGIISVTFHLMMLCFKLCRSFH